MSRPRDRGLDFSEEAMWERAGEGLALENWGDSELIKEASVGQGCTYNEAEDMADEYAEQEEEDDE